MAFDESPDVVVIATALTRLENLAADEYIIAFGPDGKQFCGTPNGYSATHLPAKVLSEVSAGHIKKIVWASYGSDAESWFFAFETTDGANAFQIGHNTPIALRQFILLLSESEHLLASLRVQLGDKESFVVWTHTVWACSDIPHALQDKLCQLSSAFRESHGVTKGSLKSGTLDNVQWHRNGTFYAKTPSRHTGFYTTKFMLAAWNELWKERGPEQLSSKIQNELAYVAIDTHAPCGETFAFFKKQQPGKEAPFVIHFGQEGLRTNLVSSDEYPPATSMQHVPQKPDEPAHYQWAVSRKSGRPHAKESWELDLKKGEKLKVLRDMGRDWHVVEGSNGIIGWVHRSWLDFGDRKLHTNAKTAYVQFQEDLQKLLVPGQLCNFPSMVNYMDACTKPECQLLKEDVSSLGICLHDLMVLLEGAGSYSYEWLKEGRNMWHPDRFARFCHADYADRLKPMAEQMFVFYGILMDMCKV
ncbi:uncharacterized protein K460DRAFT_304513 [Cucurbitaria berberidis CBS 394.84]|uniref:SH3 domain-containing protein n=1 Tax=Cucurbitaria berberidis CBS 394.84 TaxID=1168544 RepID=A0A9P4GPR7_9PLEO|nr:uncharacterized protein K460DRAFT_304513 [Cucurbitaria berberidis CBS 394.84]KAF1848906.1 hypothetical protein K460DRAFT_304513 [Cucurbitaria berberidis CBS 394.84]